MKKKFFQFRIWVWNSGMEKKWLCILIGRDLESINSKSLLLYRSYISFSLHRRALVPREAGLKFNSKVRSNFIGFPFIFLSFRDTIFASMNFNLYQAQEKYNNCELKVGEYSFSLSFIAVHCSAVVCLSETKKPQNNVPCMLSRREKHTPAILKHLRRVRKRSMMIRFIYVYEPHNF